MADPTHKSEGIESFLRDILGVNRRQAISEDVCAVCNGPAMEFKDDLSRKEYTISGMCQDCQDKMFGDPNV